jgi:hypothetical protein
MNEYSDQFVNWINLENNQVREKKKAAGAPPPPEEEVALCIS